MAWTVNTSGLNHLRARIEAGRRLLPDIMELGINTAAEATVQELHEKCPVDDELDNGVIPGEEEHLNESFLATPAQSDGEHSIAQVKTEEPIKFSYVTQGTIDLSPILPVVARGLWWPALRHPVAFVMGQNANPFQEPIKDIVEENGPEYFAEALAELAAVMED